MVPSGGVYLAALCNKFTWICCKRAASPMTNNGDGLDLDFQCLPARVDQRPRGLHGLGGRGPQID